MIVFIKEKLLENWFLKLSAIVLAWILWLFIQGEPGTVTIVAASVRVINLPPQMEISSDFPSEVQVTMRGTSQPLTCTIDLQNAKEGTNKFNLTGNDIKSQKGLGVEVSKINPSQVTLILEGRVSKEVPIAVQVEGDVADGFDIYETITDPEKVEITGPRSHIEDVEEISTEKIDLNGLKQDVNFRVDLNVNDGMIHPSITDPIWVEIRIGPHRKLYVVKKVTVAVGNESLVASPEQIDIQVKAPENLQPKLVPNNFSVTIGPGNYDEATSPVKAKPLIIFQRDWVGKIKVLGTIPSEVTIRKIESDSPKQ
jgi:YbbR domain-containing protein